ncbi:MAG: hypothetical protein C7B44_11075 [Sulfobacillus thermosulfidooxidans]|nr:MAG: hypothetical protein C7B44_11075 [Sulfobacillus thermosulfidooxidans]
MVRLTREEAASGMANTSETPRRGWRIRWVRVIGILVSLGIVIPGLVMVWGYFSLKSDAKVLKRELHAKQYVALGLETSKLSATIGLMHDALYLTAWVDAIPIARGYWLNGMTLLGAGHDYLYGMRQGLDPILTVLNQKHLSPGQRAPLLNQAVTQAGLNMQKETPTFMRANAALQRLSAQDIPPALIRKGLDIPAIQAISQTFVSILPMMTGPHPVFAKLIGFPHAVRYFLVFQNSGELRATGGFMTAYAYVPFHDGKLGKITSQNIQELDSQVTYHPPAPTVIGAYLPVTYWHLRDANTSPDVPRTVDNIERFYRSIPGAPAINGGMIFIDTWFVDDLIRDVGGLNVPTVAGKTIHLTASNANYEMEYMAEGMGLPANLRKLFIGTMMKELMHKVFHGHVSELLKVGETFYQALNDKQVLLYFDNKDAEALAARYHWAGIIPKKVDGNYLQVVDENLLGHKDNYYVRESYVADIKRRHGQYVETVTIHWIDPAIVNWWLTVPYHSWVRVYAPYGSQFVSMTGIDSYAQVTNEKSLNKTVFGGHVDLPGRFLQSQPPSKGTVVVTFTLPKGVNVKRMLVQKQPGMLDEPVRVTVNGVTRHFMLANNQWLTF